MNNPSGAIPAPRQRDGWWILALLAIAAVFGETVASANTPLLAYVVRPATLPFLMIAYGCWALLLREAWVRGWIGWPAAILLGIAYAAFNEGIVADTWFRAAQFSYSSFRLGRIDGVNWCLIASLSVFHTFASMGMPIAVVQAWRGETTPRPWLRVRGMTMCVALVALVAFGFLHGVGGKPAEDQRARAVTASMIALIVAACFVLPRLRPRPCIGVAPSLRRVLITGLGFAVGVLAVHFFIPAAFGIASVPVAVALGVVIWRYLWQRTSLTGAAGWTPRHTIALIFGGLVPPLIGDLLLIPVLQPVTVLATVAGLWRLDRMLKARRPGEVRPAPVG